MGQGVAVMGVAVRARAAAGLALLALAAGCTNDAGDGRTREMRQVASQIFQGAPPPPQPTALPSRAQLDASPGAYLLARIEVTGGDALMVVAGRNGPVRTWTTAEGTTIALREGVLVATRGLRGLDLMSAAVPSIGQLQQGTGRVTRSHFYLDGDDQTVRRDFVCELRNAGAETVIVIERSYPVRHIVESCTGAAGAFENQYWIEASGFLRRSRQWIGPELGSVELDLLKD